MGGLRVPCQVTELILQTGKKWEIPGSEADLGEVQPLLKKYSPPCPDCSESPAQKAYIEDSVRYDSSLCDVQNVPAIIHPPHSEYHCVLDTEPWTRPCTGGSDRWRNFK